MLYFLHSTSVLSFYIDVVLTLSISRHGELDVNNTILNVICCKMIHICPFEGHLQ